jgi:hypothetical protein
MEGAQQSAASDQGSQAGTDEFVVMSATRQPFQKTWQ